MPLLSFKGGNTALNLAAEFGHLPVVTLLVAKGSNIDAANEVINVLKRLQCMMAHHFLTSKLLLFFQ